MKLTSKHLLAATLLLAITNTNSYAGKMYKWVDKNGVVSYQDQPPPKNAKVLSEKEVKPGSGTSTSVQPAGLPTLVLYTVDGCDLCELFVGIMNKAQIPHIQRPLENDREAQSKILASADSIKPPTLFVGDKVVQVASGAALRETLKAAGYRIPATAK